MFIRNLLELIEKGDSVKDGKARALALDVVESVLSQADPMKAVLRSISLQGDRLFVFDDVFDLKDFRSIFVVGGGKAGGGMAMASEKVLGKYLTKGFVNIPEGTKDRYTTSKVKLSEAAHPVPSKKGVEGSREIVELVKKADKRDLVIVLISGGASALIPLPAQGIVLKDIQGVTKALLKSGADIRELNTVRKHLSSIKGGRLLQAAYPARVISLIISDVVGDPLDVIASGSTIPDRTTFRDALDVLKKYGLLDSHKAVKEHLDRGARGLIHETLKDGDPALDLAHNYLISTNKAVLESVTETLKERAFVKIQSTSLSGEARMVGMKLGRELRDRAGKKTDGKPLVMLYGGETTVHVTGSGRGGRNQELVLAALKEMRGEGICIASFGTDGIDGMTDAAGAIADGQSLQRARRLGLSPDEDIQNNDSYNFFRQMGDLIFTGPTGTNINDVIVAVAL